MLKLLLNSNYVTISKLFNSLKSMGIAIGKTTVDNYLSYIESSYFMHELYIRNPSVINQLQYPRKIYFVDTGFMTALSANFSKNSGRLFENLVFQNLAQKKDSLYYYKDDQDNEVDFVILEDGKTTALYQVCFDLTDEDTQKREIKPLLKAGKTFNCQNLYLLTLEKPDSFKLPPEIKLVTAAEFLL
jgi:predicted AAA+ superfamily ATPase